MHYEYIKEKMAYPLIGIHAALGEFGVFAFLWVFVELVNASESSIQRAKIAALLGTMLFFLAWIVGGYYYVTAYSTEVKPLVKEGPLPWAHGIVMETKEHVFLFLPFLSLFTLALLKSKQKNLLKDKKSRKALLILAGFIVLLGLAMAGFGYLISAGARLGLGG